MSSFTVILVLTLACYTSAHVQTQQGYGQRLQSRVRYLSPRLPISAANKQLLRQGLVCALGSGLTFGKQPQRFAIDTNGDLVVGFAVCDGKGQVFDSQNNQLLGAIYRGIPTLQQVGTFIRGNDKYSQYLNDGLDNRIHNLGNKFQSLSRCIIGCGALYTGVPFVLDCAGNIIVGNAEVQHYKGLILVRDSFTRRAVGYLTKISQVSLKSPLFTRAVSQHSFLSTHVDSLTGLTSGYFDFDVPRNVILDDGYLGDDYDLAVTTGYTGQRNVLTGPRNIVGRPRVLGRPRSIIRRPSSIIGRPRSIIGRPSIGRPRTLIGRSRNIIGRPHSILGRSRSIISRPHSIINRPHSLIGRPHSIIGGRRRFSTGQIHNIGRTNQYSGGRSDY